MTFLGLVFRNLRRRPGRSIFTLLGVALAVASFMTLAGLARGLQDGAQVSLEDRGVDVVVTRNGMVEAFGGSLPGDLEARIEAVPEVAQASGVLLTMLEVGDGLQALVAGWDPAGASFKEATLLRGRLPVPGAKEVVLGEVLAESLRVDVGDAVTLNFEPIRVAGIGDFGNGISRGMALMPLEDLQTLLGQEDRVTLFEVRLKTRGDAAEARAVAAISAFRRDLRVAPSDEALRNSKTLEILASAALAIGAVAMAMACLSVLNTLAMAVEERVREIGILSAIGWARERILGLILFEGVLLSAVGGAIGIGLGTLGSHLLGAFLLPGSALSAQGVMVMGAQAMAVALAVGALGAFWPALRASGLPPAAALRQQ